MPLTMGRRLHFLLFGLFALVSTTRAAVLPPGFTERIIASGLSEPTAMAVAPDGRVFVCEQGGGLRVIKNGALLPTPFATFDVDPTGERGLLGVALDPNFSINGYVYVYYTAPTSPRHNRIARLAANGDVAIPESETMVMELDDLGTAAVHNGGAMHFGADGMLYIAVGDNSRPTEAQSLDSFFGKILRIEPDGSIPSDNPFLDQTSGNRGVIWALGLRNPFTFDIQPGTSHLLINDVGENSWEEINQGFAGANYGWPIAEGPGDRTFVDPILAYPHDGPPFSGCAITGGAFYPASASAFPSGFSGKYFFADFCGGWIRTLDPLDGSSTEFASGISLPVDLKAGPDGSLYYLARGEDRLFQIFYTGVSAPVITESPASQTIAIGKDVTFTVEASGAQPLAYQWQENSIDISAANSSSFTLNAVKSSDDGAEFRCVVSNAMGSAISVAAILHVTTNQPPLAEIQAPSGQTLYAGGDTISYSGTAMDPEDGELPPAAFTWWVDFHHATHFHPFLPPQSGARNGSFVVPTIGEKSPHVWYRIHLKVVDSAGLPAETFRDVLPRVTQVTLNTQPEGLQLSLDGAPAKSPMTFTGVAGIVRTLATPQLQDLGGITYQFDHWSDGGAAQHDFSTPINDATLTAVFIPADQTAASIVQFSSNAYQVNEGDGHIDISVLRSGSVSSSLDVWYETNDGTATDRSDYLPALGRLNFAAGETSKIIRVLITDGSVPESNETFSLTLTGVSGLAALGSPSIATVTIVDDDTVPATSNPSDDTEFFVRQQYQDFLNREADESGLEFWMNEISICGADSQCREIKRQDVSAAFFLSIEFQQTGDLVYRLNVAAFERFPRFRDFLRDSQALGRDVIVGQGDWQQQLQNNQTAFLTEFVERPEFLAAYPETLSAAEFVDKLNMNAGLSLSPEERDELVQAMNSRQMDRSAVLSEIANNSAFVIREFNRAFVLLQYFGYLRRDPDDVPDTDLTGYNFWLQKLNQFNGNYDRAQMVIAFIRSTEYRQRFGP